MDISCVTNVADQFSSLQAVVLFCVLAGRGGVWRNSRKVFVGGGTPEFVG